MDLIQQLYESSKRKNKYVIARIIKEIEKSNNVEYKINMESYINRAFEHACCCSNFDAIKYIFEYGYEHKYNIDIHYNNEYMFRQYIINIRHTLTCVNTIRMIIEYCEKRNSKINIYTYKYRIFNLLESEIYDMPLIKYLIYLRKNNYNNNNNINNIKSRLVVQKILIAKFTKTYIYQMWQHNYYIKNNVLIELYMYDTININTYSINYTLYLYVS